MLTVSPVKGYPVPRYPDWERALSDPAVLLSTPQRWKRSAAACAAMTATAAMLLSACRTGPDAAGSPTPSPSPLWNPTPAPSPAAAVAPLFEHGSGMAYYGCVSVAPPVFLSEEEAYTVISQVARAEGLHFEIRDHTMKQVPVPQTSLYYGSEERDPIRGYQIRDLVLDGYDESTGVGFEFVSSADIGQWAVEEQGGSSVDCYRFIESARALEQGLEASSEPLTVAVFYEPGSDSRDTRVQSIFNTTKDYHERGRELKELAKEDLREQVRDFIAWLRAEGIL